MKAITLGSAMIDIITLVADESVERMTMHNEAASFLLLEQGRKIDAISITTHVGGGGVNSAVCLARQGWNVATHVKLGQDMNADRVLECLSREGIGTDPIARCSDCDTGTAVMVSSHDRNATIFTYRGANTRLSPWEMTDAMFDGCDLTYVASLSNQSVNCLPTIIAKARAAGSTTAFNPGIRQITSRTAELLDLLTGIDILILNRVEAAAMVPGLCARLDAFEPGDGQHFKGPDIPRLLRTGLEAAGFALSLPAFARALQQQGARHVVVTDGADGAYVLGGEGIHYCPMLKTRVAGTAGAGDAFGSTLAATICSGGSVDDAMQRAAVNASSVVSHIDTQKGLLAAQELDRRTQENRARLPVRFWPFKEQTS